MDTLEHGLFKEGFCMSPNTPTGFPYGTHRWYPSAPGIPCPVQPYEVVIYNDEILIYRLRCDNDAEPSKRFTVWPIAGFKTVESFMNYCMEYGMVSEPGLPSFYNSND